MTFTRDVIACLRDVGEETIIDDLVDVMIELGVDEKAANLLIDKWRDKTGVAEALFHGDLLKNPS